MNYVELDLKIDPIIPYREILVALLAEKGFESFTENSQGLKAFIPSVNFNKETIEELLSSLEAEVNFSSKEIDHRNWNEEWERNYQPMLIDERCIVRAPFHRPRKEFPFELIIEPRMSFGTGHHPTTILMLKMLLDLDVKSKTVLDLGTGTGVLAILAEKKGAVSILATDIDEHVVSNAKDNIRHNDCVEIRVDNADLRQKAEGSYDLILANINLNTLLAGFQNLASSAKEGARLILSGFYDDDADQLIAIAEHHGFKLVEQRTQQRWTALQFIKSGSSLSS